MIRIAVSNIGLPRGNHAGLFSELAGHGAEGLEVAPSRVWNDTFASPTAAAVEDYRRAANAAGLRILGLHSLFFDHPEFGLFEIDRRAETLDFLVHLSSLCRDLGGDTLVYGGGRRRRDFPAEKAAAECDAFLSELLPRIEGHGTWVRHCGHPHIGEAL